MIDLNFSDWSKKNCTSQKRVSGQCQYVTSDPASFVDNMNITHLLNELESYEKFSYLEWTFQKLCHKGSTTVDINFLNMLILTGAEEHNTHLSSKALEKLVMWY